MLSILSILSTGSHAFCGAYVGPVGSTLENGASRVIVAQYDDEVTLTMANDVTGDVTDFAMVVPVPVVLGPEDVRIVDQTWVEMLDGYTSPRLVSYTCDQLTGWDSGHYMSHGGGCSGIGCYAEMAYRSSADTGAMTSATDAFDSVNIEAEFAIGAYEIVVLSADESSDLLGWLKAEGYALPADGDVVLQDYIDDGVFFFAVRVSLDALPEGVFLDPLQFSYPAGPSAPWSLPTRLGALNAEGMQEVLLYTLTTPEKGRTRPQNAGPVFVEDDCMPPSDDIDSFYEAHLSESFEGVLPGHSVEYAWPGWDKCDPCAPGFEAVDPQMLEAFGYPANPKGKNQDRGFEVYFTRIRLRYDADDPADLIFEPTYDVSQREQVRFIQYEEYLESEFPVCGVGMAENPGTCDDETSKRRRPSTGGLNFMIWGGLAALGIAARRRGFSP